MGIWRGLRGGGVTSLQVAEEAGKPAAAHEACEKALKLGLLAQLHQVGVGSHCPEVIIACSREAGAVQEWSGIAHTHLPPHGECSTRWSAGSTCPVGAPASRQPASAIRPFCVSPSFERQQAMLYLRPRGRVGVV